MRVYQKYGLPRTPSASMALPTLFDVSICRKMFCELDCFDSEIDDFGSEASNLLKGYTVMTVN